MGQRSKRKWWNYKNPREKLKDKPIWIWIWQFVLCYDAKAQAIKEKINWTSLKSNQTLSQRTLSRTWKDNSQNGKIFLSHISDNDLVSRLYKELLPLNNKKATQL